MATTPNFTYGGEGDPRSVGMRAPVNPNFGNPDLGPQQPSPEARAWRAPPNVPGAAAGTAAKVGLEKTMETAGRTAARATATGLRTAGQAAGRMAVGNSNAILSGIGATATHGNAYFDGSIPVTDRLRIAGSDVTAGLGGFAGTALGAGAGSVAGPVGAFVGGAAGGAAGLKGGRALGDAFFSADDVLSKHGYDPHRGLLDVGTDLLAGKGGDAFGTKDYGVAHDPGAGRGFVNPAAVDPGAAAPLAARPDTGAGGGRGFVNPTTLPQADDLRSTLNGVPDLSKGLPPNMDAGQIYKTVDPKTGRVTYSGANVGPNARMVNELGAPQSMRGGVTTFNGPGPGAGIDPRVAQAQGAALARGESLAPGGVAGFSSTTRGNMRAPADPNSEVLDLVKNSGLNARGAALALQGRGQNNEAAAATARNATQIQTTSMANEASLRNAQMQRETQLQTTAMNNEVQARGQDMTSATAKLQGKMQQMQNDRQFQLEQQKFGVEQAKTLHAQREQGTKDFADWAASVTTTTDQKTGKAIPNQEAQAEFIRTATHTLGVMADKLQAKGDPASVAAAEKLRSQGFGGLDASDKAMLLKGFKGRQIFNAGAGGFDPTTSSGPTSDDLTSFLVSGPANGLLQKRMSLGDPKDGRSISVDQLRYGQKANTILPNFGSVPNDDLLKGMR